MLLKLSSEIKSRKFDKGTKMIAIVSHRLIYTYLISIRLLDIVKIGVGCYCFIRTKGNARAGFQDKADIVPTPYFLSAFFGELGRHTELSNENI